MSKLQRTTEVPPGVISHDRRAEYAALRVAASTGTSEAELRNMVELAAEDARALADFYIKGIVPRG
ncbi:hypothetical protein PJ900_21800 [Tistrella mobilis]|uniref:Uncharacterized protein n=1 Tax=Tistrella mobilis TaxID=171437 RepID=A0A162L743_9PROT|nr:hypothetical protein [Tistrella mobilis]KYO53558.1 hypothetical protein AUP44_00500 [Tistrella mobilis]